jgi:hypothetical protein
VQEQEAGNTRRWDSLENQKRTDGRNLAGWGVLRANQTALEVSGQAMLAVEVEAVWMPMTAHAPAQMRAQKAMP